MYSSVVCNWVSYIHQCHLSLSLQAGSLYFFTGHGLLIMLKNRQDAFTLLQSFNAPLRLITHHQLVLEAVDKLLEVLSQINVKCDIRLIELGAALHDAGKIIHPEELDRPGHFHEQAGYQLLLANGVEFAVAQCCVSHAAWQAAGTSFEEHVISLADKLWKGKRETGLEELVISEIAVNVSSDFWEIYSVLDNAFEEIAAQGVVRLQKSHSGL